MILVYKMFTKHFNHLNRTFTIGLTYNVAFSITLSCTVFTNVINTLSKRLHISFRGILHIKNVLWLIHYIQRKSILYRYRLNFPIILLPMWNLTWLTEFSRRTIDKISLSFLVPSEIPPPSYICWWNSTLSSACLLFNQF